MARMIFSASTAVEALERAADALKLPVDALEMEILEDNRDQTEDETSEENEGVCIRAHVARSFVAQESAALLRRMLSAMGVEGQVEILPDEQAIILEITGPHSSLLIGRDGQTLDSIQHWLIRAMSRLVYSTPKILVDVENYRSRKFDKLGSMARRVAKRVVQNHQAERLSPMGSVERKFVHNCLKGFDGVTTFSTGREGRRQVIISPTDTEGATEAAPPAREKASRRKAPPKAVEDKMPKRQYAEDEFIEDDLLKSESTFSQLRVIATSASSDADGLDLLDDLTESPKPSKAENLGDELEDELH